MPSLWERAKHFTRAMARGARSGFEILGEGEVKAQLVICKGCPFLHPSGTCAKRGCPVARKALLPSEFCDDDRWRRVDKEVDEAATTAPAN